MKIAAWNVNSVRARAERLVDWLASRDPDIACLQETKCEDHQFPFELVGDLGYEVTHYGQKSYNGVAILSKKRPDEVIAGFSDGAEEDASRRILWARFGTLWVASVYVPNGQSVGSDKYQYKLRWFERFTKILASRPSDLPVIVGGDYNVAPADLDVHAPEAWRNQTLCSEPERAAFELLLAQGYTDSFRAMHPDRQAFSWWDYRMLGFQKNRGLRIDHWLMNHVAYAKCTSVEIDREARKGDDPSDHAPIICEIDQA